jgi:hypothetical protein
MTSPPNIYQNFPHIGNTVLGRDFNFFNKVTVTWSTFGGNTDGYAPDLIITFPTYTVTFQLESGGPVQYSFNGHTIHGDMTTGLPSASLTFQNRVISKIWFKGSGTVRVEAWGIR